MSTQHSSESIAGASTAPTARALAPVPSSLLEGGALREGLFAGALGDGALPTLPGRGRRRGWSYVAAASDDGRFGVGAAVASLGIVGTAFVWLLLDGAVHDVSRRLGPPNLRVGTRPGLGASARSRGLHLAVGPTGELSIDVGDLGGHQLAARLRTDARRPVVCATATPAGGYNVTEKSAGQRVTGAITIDGLARDFTGAGWSDWTWGRQDRRTQWRWAAAAGREANGRAVGLNLSTGMNGAGPTENVVWIDGVPRMVELQVLEPVDGERPEGPWRISGPGWSLRFTPAGVRRADENLLIVRSSYVQPVGTFAGTLPAGGGDVVEVRDLAGVTEDHRALW